MTTPWRLTLDDADTVQLHAGGSPRSVTLAPGTTLALHRRWPWSRVQLGEHRLDGLPHAQAQSLHAAITAVVTDQDRRARQAAFNTPYRHVIDWLMAVGQVRSMTQRTPRWITHEQQQAMLAARERLAVSSAPLHAALADQDVLAALPEALDTVRSRLEFWQKDWPAVWAEWNEAHTARELVACQDLFDRVEKQPLTPEQARAVVCFDNRVQVLAAAGSGKTSTMVAKAIYAVHRGIAAPERIVLLAFNRRAAEELQARTDEALARVGMSDTRIAASTFHALGLGLIGQATGRKPHVPDWAVDTQAGLERLSAIIDGLKDADTAFRTRWDLFRLVFGRDLPAPGVAAPADGWGRDGRGYMRTLRGERVRSLEECTIANWLFYNGVDYAYERAYEVDTATATHRQYHPDFYYPDAALYHEHLALDADGRAPEAFGDYLGGVAWKRECHQAHGTALVETTSHQLRTGTLFDHLARALTQRGVVLDPNPDRPVPPEGHKPMQPAELVALVRTFITHVKSNALAPADLQRRLDAMPAGVFTLRHQMFLDLVGPIQQAWDDALAAADGIDFEDMLNQAAAHLEAGRCAGPFDLVIADEFQDASRARARLCRALVAAPNRHFVAVGDDWQSINRFAGADMTVMTDFSGWFGPGQRLQLSRTFRCPQALCDVSGRFVTRNPQQLAKPVQSSTPAVGPVLQAIESTHARDTQAAIADFLQDLHDGLAQGRIPPGRGGKVSVYVLGRYNADQGFIDPTWASRFRRWLDVSFLTIHRSKGSEADYVILPAMVSVTRGRSFPDTRAEDPVMALAMPQADTYALSEERRLFYVALTRARRGVAMFTVRGQHSRFLTELLQGKAVTLTRPDDDETEHTPCPACGQGVIITRQGRHGDFLACSNFPVCEYKPR